LRDEMRIRIGIVIEGIRSKMDIRMVIENVKFGIWIKIKDSDWD
jgi:hypothetical protein